MENFKKALIALIFILIYDLILYLLFAFCFYDLYWLINFDFFARFVYLIIALGGGFCITVFVFDELNL